MKYYWKSISGNSIIFLIGFIIGFLFLSCNLFGQPAQTNKSDYLFPIRPGQLNYLSGSMGELRSNHFHAGIDIKTGGVEGSPVYAVADGFVSRIKVSAGGYGNALYLRHPDGKTSVYAHLRNYNHAIASYVRQRQYENKTFEIELFPGKEELPVKRGQQLGLSGNSGSSGGPHLHFEIRDENQDVLNPLHYGFKEVKDDIPPSVDAIAFLPLNMNSRVNHQFLRREYSPVRKGSTYTLNEPVTAYGSIGVQILAYDRLNGATNKNGVSCIDMTVNGEEVYYQNIEKFSFDETRNILAHFDYKKSVETGRRYQKLYIDDGNELSFYRRGGTNGRLSIESGKEYSVTIHLYDSYHNHSQINFVIRGSEPLVQLTSASNDPAGLVRFEAIGNLLKITGKALTGDEGIEVFSNRMIYDIKPAYRVNDIGVYFWNMHSGLPDSIKTLTGTIYTGYQAMIPSGAAFTYYNEAMDIETPQGALFDTLLLSVKKTESAGREYFHIGDKTIPLKRHIYVTLKPSLDYGQKKKTGVYSVDDRGSMSYYGGEWKGDQIRFGLRDFGVFTLLADTIPPTISTSKVNANEISFYIDDKHSGIKTFRLEVNGDWVLMNYDYKTKLIWSEKLDPSKPFSGEVVLKVSDHTGNESVYKSKL